MKLKNNFYKEIIFSDFYINNNYKFKLINQQIKLNSKVLLFSVNIFKIIKELKQILKLIKFLKEKSINIYSKNFQLNTFFIELSELFKLRKKLKFIIDSNKITKSKNIISFEKKININQLKYFFNYKVYIFSLFSIYKNINFGHYTINNNINNFKKVIYLFIILKNLIKKPNAIKQQTKKFL